MKLKGPDDQEAPKDLDQVCDLHLKRHEDGGLTIGAKKGLLKGLNRNRGKHPSNMGVLPTNMGRNLVEGRANGLICSQELPHMEGHVSVLQTERLVRRLRFLNSDLTETNQDAE